MNYENVPDEKDAAEKKLGDYLDLINKDKDANNSACYYSIDAALSIYMNNLSKKHPNILNSNDQKSENKDKPSEQPSTSKKCPSEKIIIDDLFKPENQDDTCNRKKKILMTY